MESSQTRILDAKASAKPKQLVVQRIIQPAKLHVATIDSLCGIPTAQVPAQMYGKDMDDATALTGKIFHSGSTGRADPFHLNDLDPSRIRQNSYDDISFWCTNPIKLYAKAYR